MSSDARILIVGAGVGGLALAQALRRGGIDVTVYEQDPTPTIRNQGYRIHIDSNGNAALRTCLSAEALDLVRRSSGHNGDLFAAYTHHLDQVMVQTFPEIADDDITCVDRNAFRHALLTGMADDVHFGKRLSGYQLTDSGRVRVEFADGGGDEGDVLVGADGVGSAVRRQLLPDATVRDLGLRCLYGRMTITETTEPLIPQDLHRGFSWGRRRRRVRRRVRTGAIPRTARRDGGLSDDHARRHAATSRRRGCRPVRLLLRAVVEAGRRYHRLVALGDP
ncbi:FAD-dependent monooxygenase [Nocardia gipuzkoensis]|uniref:FAD-dependent oxidoreductase n=1 Tax=Nocardia gipuzkoensis TaxID=2749991 RepID=UPI001E3C9112|nr:FAD-dependent monooxygenase [Nocardia gipuzkoensis]UGT66837.1 FAD-dependent monooxygenase [Nocardia gipuzkoensis]